MPDFDPQRAANSISHLQRNLQSSTSKIHNLTEALQSIKGRVEACERINLAGKSVDAKVSATLRNILAICDLALENNR